MSGFSNSILGGMSKLIRAAIQSPNFVHGSTGWSINKNGTAEFNNIIIRNGTVISGVFLLYSSATPALGNLVVSFAPIAGGTDTVGNVYPQGFNFGVWNNAGVLQQHFGLDDNGNVYLVNAANQTTIFMNPSTESIGFYPAGTGLNNLSLYIAAVVGNDSFGNGQIIGFTSQTPGGGLFININTGVISFTDTAAADTITRQGAMRQLHVAAHNNNPVLAIDSGACDANGSHASIWLLGLPQSGAGNTQIAFFAETGAGAAAPLQVLSSGEITGATIAGGLPVPTGASASLLPGDLTVQSSVDNQFYDTQVQHVDLPSTSITAVTPAFTAIGNPATVAARKYKFHVRGDYTEAAAGIARLALALASGAVVSSARLTAIAAFNSNTVTSGWAGVGVGTLGPVAGANPMTSKNFIVDIWGEAVFSTGGTATFSANTSAAGDPYTWNGGTMEVYPVA